MNVVMEQISAVNPDGLKLLAANYLHDVDLTPIDEAWELAVGVHRGGKHFSGEPYLIHALEVASTLASMHLDLDTIIAGLLHGSLKNGVRYEELEEKFGRDVAYIVSGTTKITSVQYNNRLASQAENVRKMLLAMADDIRVQRLDVDVDVAFTVVVELCSLPLGDLVGLHLGLGQRDARPEACDDSPVRVPARARRLPVVEAGRIPDIGAARHAGVGRHQELESRRHHAYDRVRKLVDDQRSADRLG